MAATKTVFLCQNCGASSPKWIGKCPSCGEWNTYVEEVIVREKPQAWKKNKKSIKEIKPLRLSEISLTNQHRLITPDEELNRTLGGGIVPGSVVLIGGEPGFGKSTLMLQLALS